MIFTEPNATQTAAVLGNGVEYVPPGRGSSADTSGGGSGGGRRPGRRAIFLALSAVVVAATLITALVVVTFGPAEQEQSIERTVGVDRVVAGAPDQSALPGVTATLAPLRVDGLPLESRSSDAALASAAVRPDSPDNLDSSDNSDSSVDPDESASTSSALSADSKVADAGEAAVRAPGATVGVAIAGGASTTASRPTTAKPTTSATARLTTTVPTTAKPTTAKPTTAPSTTSGPSTTAKPTTAKPTTTRPATSRPTTTRQTTTTTRPTTASTARPTTSSAPPPSSGRVIWEENFNSLDSSRWKVEHSTYGDGNNELQCYRPENVSVANGKLTLRAVTESYTCPNGQTRQVTSGMIRSRGVTFSPGQALEFRVKLNPANPNDQSGLWPAIWSSGWAGGGWPAGGELDYLEVMTAENPNRAMFSMHHADPSGRHKLQNKGIIDSEYFSNSWHTIKFEYGHNGNLVWFLDGVEAFRVDSATTLQGFPAPFDQGIGEIKINLALGGRPGPLSSGAVGSAGASFEVDFIRILEI